jgi:tRNA-dihydrouridine synthase A
MLGRAAYHDPWVLADVDKTRAEVVEHMVEYCRRQRDVPLRSIARHMLGLYHGLPGARLWRRMLSDPARLRQNRPELFYEAREVVEGAENVVCP